MKQNRNSPVRRKWHEKYLPFVAKSRKMQLEWLVDNLSRVRLSCGKEKRGLLTREELKPYISLLLEGSIVESESGGASGSNELGILLADVPEADLITMVECAEIYDVPKLFAILGEISLEQAVLAMKKVPPPYEKSPLLLVDMVFHAIKEKSTILLEEAAEVIMGSDDIPEEFTANYRRFREIMMDEHILRVLYPKAN